MRRIQLTTLLVLLTMLLSPHLAMLEPPENPSAASGRSVACGGVICISEIFVNAVGTESDAVGPSDWTTGEWVEIYNSGGTTVDLSGWYVRDHYDSSSRQVDFTTTHIVWPQNPQNADLAAGDYMVVARNGVGASCGLCLTNTQGLVKLYDSTGSQQHEATWSTYATQAKSLIAGSSSTADWVEVGSITPGQANTGGGVGPTWSVSDLRISEVLPDSWPTDDNSTYPGGEWAEIENTGTSSINLTGWKILDATGNSLSLNGSHLVDHASSTMIEAGQRRVVAVNGLTEYGVFNNANGDSVFLLNPAGEYVSGANYSGPTKMGHSYVSPSFGNGNWLTSLFPTPGATNARNANGSSPVRINEVMVNATNSWASYPNGEWIELSHRGSDPGVDVAGWKLVTGTGQQIAADVGFADRDSGTGTIVDSGSYVVLAVPPTTAEMVVNGDRLSILDASGVIFDSIEWGADPGTNRTIISSDIDLPAQPQIISGWATPAAANPNQLSGSVDETADFRISEIMANPSGSDTNTYPEGEWIEIVNVGNDTASFQGWKLQDGRGVKLALGAQSIPGLDEAVPSDWELAAGEHLAVWRNGHSMNLQNSGDVISLLDDDGNTVQQIIYSLTPSNGTLVAGTGSADDWVPSPWPTPGSPNPEFDNPYTGGLDIEISEVMAQCTAGSLVLDGDWLELKNAGTEAINLSRWLVVNDNGDTLVLRDSYLIHFTDGSPDDRDDWGTLAPGAYVVVKPENNGFLSNFDELVDLRDPNQNVRQEVRWSTSENCKSMEGDAGAWNEDWWKTMWPTPGEENPVPVPWDPTDPVIFTRIMPGQVHNRDNEFIEITNMGDSIVNLAGWKLDRTKVDGTVFSATFNALLLDPGESVVISQAPENLSWDGGIDAVDMAAVLDNSMWLYDSGSSLQLLAPDGTVSDAVVYAGGLTDLDGWSGPAIGTPPTNFQGLIFMRGDGCDSMPDTNTSADWEYRWLRLGASLFCDAGVFSTSGSLTPMASPDGSLYQFLEWLDGSQDSLHIHVYELMSNDIVAKLVELSTADVDVTVILEEDPLEGGDDLYKIRGMAYELYAAGVTVYWMGNPQGENAPPAAYQYIHSKVGVRDDNSVWIGSGNLKESTFPAGDYPSNRDWGLIIDSPDVAQLVLSRMLWDENVSHPQLNAYSVTDSSTGRPTGWTSSGPSGIDAVAPSTPIPTITGDFTGQVLTCPDDCVNGIVDLLDSAEVSIELSLQGFSQNWHWGFGENPLMAAVERALERGVAVRLLINGYYAWTDDGIRDTANQFNNQWNRTDGYDATAILMSPADRIVKLHNKGVIVDSESVLISSINWNSNAILRNREMGIVVHNNQLAEWYLASFEEDWNRVDNSTDTDGDNMPDKWEMENGLNRTSSVVPGSSMPEQSHDNDGDGLENLREMSVQGHPLKADTDGDCINDLQELVFATLKGIPESDAILYADADNDGVADGVQTECGATLAGGTGETPDGGGDDTEPTPELPERENPLDSAGAKVLLTVVGLAAFALLFALGAVLLTGRESASGVVLDETLDLAEMMAQEAAFADAGPGADAGAGAGPGADAGPGAGAGATQTTETSTSESAAFASPEIPNTAELGGVTGAASPAVTEPLIKDMRDDKTARDDGVHGAAQLDGFAFEGWTAKQVQDSLASGWTMEQLQELYGKGGQS